MKVNGLSTLTRELNALNDKVDKTVKDIMQEFAKLVMQDAFSNIPDGSTYLKSTYNIEESDNGYTVTLYSGDEFAAYVEFGTGMFAAAYLAGRPQEVVDEAIKFYINGKGTMPAHPYLFPAFYKYKGWVLAELENRLNKLVV